jgi:hypothetical protein
MVYNTANMSSGTCTHVLHHTEVDHKATWHFRTSKTEVVRPSQPCRPRSSPSRTSSPPAPTPPSRTRQLPHPQTCARIRHARRGSRSQRTSGLPAPGSGSTCRRCKGSRFRPAYTSVIDDEARGNNAHPEERRQLFPVPGRRVDHVWRQYRANDANDVAASRSSARIKVPAGRKRTTRSGPARPS